MNYSAHYDRLIARAQRRILAGYRERHHIIPRCMGGGDEPENIVKLTAEEHYVAHQLLVKMHPSVRRLTFAAVRMAKRCSSNKAYGWIRRRYAKAMRGNKFRLGKLSSMETREKMSISHRGKVPSPETREKISARLRGMQKLPEHREKLRAAQLGKQQCLGRVLSQETRAKMSAARRGNQSCLGRVLSSQTKAKISAALIARNKNARAALAKWCAEQLDRQR